MATFTDTERGWMAALIDQCSLIALRARNSPEIIEPLLVIYTKKPILHRWHELVNGRLELRPKTHRITYGRQEDIKVILETVIDLLIVKRQHAEIMLEFIRSRQGEYHPYSDAEWDMVDRMIELE